MSQVWSQNMRETILKKSMKPRSKTYARCGLIVKNVEGGLIRVKSSEVLLEANMFVRSNFDINSL